MVLNKFTSRKLSPWFNILAWQVVVPIAFILIVLFFFPSRAKFQFSFDEGVNLMKAMLLEQGYPLYSEIWSDQPPLFTYLLAVVFRYFRFDVGAFRAFVLILSSVLLWASFQFMRIIGGKWLALTGALLIFLLPTYMVLSVSVMVGLPAITFATLSLLTLALWHKHRNYLWIALSAIALGLSVLTKLFTGFLAPIFIVGILVGEYVRLGEKRSLRKLLGPPMVWIGVFTGITLVLGLTLVGLDNVGQLLQSHLSAQNVEVFQLEEFTLVFHLRRAWPILFLALIGALFALRSRRWLLLYPLVWMGTAFLLFYRHTPVWDHHQLLITVPAALLAAVAVYEVGRYLIQIFGSQFKLSGSGILYAVALISIFAFFFSFRVPETISTLSPRPSLSTSGLELDLRDEKFLIKMRRFAPQTDWVVTDIAMFAFRSGLPVPPNLAVFTMKRFETGNLTEEEVIDAIQKYQPEQVLLGRRKYHLIEEFLLEDYRLIRFDRKIKLYLRNDVGT